MLVLCIFADTEVNDIDASFFLHGAERVKQDLRIQRMEQVVVFVAEMLRGFGLPVEQIRPDHAERRFFRKESRGIFPGRNVDIVLRKAEVQKPAALLVPEDPHLRVFFQLFAHGGFIDFERGIRVGQIVCNTIGDLTDTEGSTVSKNIQDAEMQYDILVSKALCLPGVVQRVESYAAVIHRDEDVFALGRVPESHVAAKPALDTAALIVIAARALFRIVLAALKP